MSLRRLLDNMEPHFHKGGRFEKWYALYEAADTIFYKPADVTKTTAHVRDGIDLKRIMIKFGYVHFRQCFRYVQRGRPASFWMVPALKVGAALLAC